ncbi:hypothetical protein D1007_00970 [Hordeum vulgare]|nr:hypothetical protein D1007_00970 [Hordeum vulgare]
MALPMDPMALQAADDDNGGQFTTHHIVDTHMRGKDLSVVYMNKLVSVESFIQTMEQLRAKDKQQVVSFDLEFTSGHTRQDQKVVVAQLSLRHDVLVYHYHLDTRPCKCFISTINKRNSLVNLVSAIIDPYYMKMKDESEKDNNAWHSAWDQRLDVEHVKYIAKDAYTSYKMYRQIIDTRKCLCPAREDWQERHRK